MATNIDLNSKLSHGRTAGKRAPIIQQGMTSERCAELICIAMSHRLRESWAIKGSALYAAYTAHYNPWFFAKFMRPVVSRIMIGGTGGKGKKKMGLKSNL